MNIEISYYLYLCCLTCPQLNANAMHNALSPDTKPWVNLGGNLGAVATAMSSDQTQGIKVTAQGETFLFF